MSKEKWIEELNSSEPGEMSSADRDIYRLIFQEMEQEPLPEVPAGFSIHVAAKETKRRSRLRDIKLYAFYAILFVFLVALSLSFSLMYSPQKNLNDVMQTIQISLAAALVYFLIETMDRLLVHKEE